MGNHTHADTSSQGSGESLVDGTGLPSPGRWRSGDRDPPNDDVAIEIKQGFADGGGTSRQYVQEDDQQPFDGWLEEKPFFSEKAEVNLKSNLKRAL